MRFVTRAEWGAERAKNKTALVAPDGVALHWNGPAMPLPDHARCGPAVKGIQRFHQQTRGWADVAYSLLVCPHGYVFEGRGANVRTAANGTQYGNANFYAVCYLGGEGDPLTADAKQAFRDAREWLMENGSAGVQVRPHSSFKPTGCPGDGLRVFAAELRGAVWSPPIPTPTPAPAPTPTPEPHEEDVMHNVIARGTGSRKYLTDLLTAKRWIRTRETVAALVKDGHKEVQGAHYDGVLDGLTEGPEIP